MKKCNRCHQDKTETDFSFKNKSKELRNNCCKSCHKTYVKNHYLNNMDSYKSRSKISNVILAKNRTQTVNEIKSIKGCYFCKENDSCCLDFHHIDESTKEFSISNKVRVNSIKVILKEIEKCVVLCSNCHRKLHAGKLKYPHWDSNPEI